MDDNQINNNNQPQEKTPANDGIFSQAQPPVQVASDTNMAIHPINPVNESGDRPSGGLSVTALILAVFTGLIGLIMSIIVFVKFKKRGVMNGLALAGIIIGSIVTILHAATGVYVAGRILEMSEKCGGTSKKTYVDKNYKVRSCIPGLASILSNDGKSLGPSVAGRIDVAEGKVSDTGGVASSTCWTFDIPESYSLRASSTACSATVMAGSGGLTAITVKSQSGEISVDKVIETMDRAAANGAKVYSNEVIKINGSDAVKTVAYASTGMKMDIYVIIDDAGKYKHGEEAITSYMISGYSYNEELAGRVELVANSFRIK